MNSAENKKRGFYMEFEDTFDVEEIRNEVLKLDFKLRECKCNTANVNELDVSVLIIVLETYIRKLDGFMRVMNFLREETGVGTQDELEMYELARGHKGKCYEYLYKLMKKDMEVIEYWVNALVAELVIGNEDSEYGYGIMKYLE